MAALAASMPQAGARVGPVFAGACQSLTLDVTYTDIDTLPGLPRTRVDFLGSAPCKMDDGTTKTTTVSGSASTLDGLENWTCAGGAALGTGEVDVPSYIGFPHGDAEGHMPIVVVERAVHLSIVGEDGVVATGVFLQDEGFVAQCLADIDHDLDTVWEGTFAFGATDALTVVP